MHFIFLGITATYAYYAFKYRYEPGDTWPRIRLDMAVLFLLILMGFGGGITIEGNEYLNVMRGRNIDMTAWSPEEQSTFAEMFIEYG